MRSEIMSTRDLNNFLDDIDKHIEQINDLYKKYKHWNVDYINEYKIRNGFSIDEIILTHINKKLKIE